jgi:hypothetical protein
MNEAINFIPPSAGDETILLSLFLIFKSANYANGMAD